MARAGRFTRRKKSARRRRNPLGYECVVSTLAGSRKGYWTGSGWDTQLGRAVRMSERTARLEATKLSREYRRPMAIESC